MRSNHIIAATFSTDAASISEYRYHSTRIVSPAVYAIGDSYYAVHKSKPKHDVGGEWVKHPDQFFASKANTTLWVARSSLSI